MVLFICLSSWSIDVFSIELGCNQCIWSVGMVFTGFCCSCLSTLLLAYNVECSKISKHVKVCLQCWCIYRSFHLSWTNLILRFCFLLLLVDLLGEVLQIFSLYYKPSILIRLGWKNMMVNENRFTSKNIYCMRWRAIFLSTFGMSIIISLDMFGGVIDIVFHYFFLVSLDLV